jgi:hypothetical protein
MAEQVLVWADFNERDQDGNVLALAEEVSLEPKLGEAVTVRDSEGNQAEAEIISVDNRLIRLRVDWNTWRAATESEAPFPIHGKKVLSVQFNEHATVYLLLPQESLIDALGAAVASTAANPEHVLSE